MKSEVVSRVVLCWVTYVTVAQALFDGSTATFWAAGSGGAWAYLSLGMLSSAATVALWDVFWNDMWPGAMNAPRSKRFRQAVWMGMAITHCAYVFVLLKYGASLLQVLPYLGYGVGACFIALLDAHTNLRNIRGGGPR